MYVRVQLAAVGRMIPIVVHLDFEVLCSGSCECTWRRRYVLQTGVGFDRAADADMFVRVCATVWFGSLQSSRSNLEPDRKSTRLNSSHSGESRMPSSA